MVAGGGPEAEVANARRQADAGFRAFKVKVGVNPAERDLQRVYTIRKALGNSVQISADANQGFSREQARVDRPLAILKTPERKCVKSSGPPARKPRKPPSSSC